MSLSSYDNLKTKAYYQQIVREAPILSEWTETRDLQVKPTEARFLLKSSRPRRWSRSHRTGHMSETGEHSR